MIAKLTLDRDDELRNDSQDLGTALLQHVQDALLCKELVWMHCFAEPVKEHGKVMMIIEFLNFYLTEKSLYVVDDFMCFKLFYILWGGGEGKSCVVLERTGTTKTDRLLNKKDMHTQNFKRAVM
jgi:hypothetical protein